MKKTDDFLPFLLAEIGEEIQFNGETRRAVIVDAQSSITFYDDKYIVTDFSVNTGDQIIYQNSDWIVISEVDQNRESFRAKIRKSNFNLKVVVEESLHNWDTIIEGISFGIDEGKYMSFEDGKIQATIPSDDISDKIDTETRFIKMGNAWKVVGVDKTRIGLNILHCEKDLFTANDDKENEIADKNKIAIWTIGINEDQRTVDMEDGYTYTATIKKNDVAITDKEIVWATSDSSIAVVNNGVVVGVATGRVNLIASMAEKPEVQVAVEIEIIEAIPDVITYKMYSSETNGSDKSYDDFGIILTSTRLFGMEKYNNGVLSSTNDTYNFVVLPNGIPSSKYTFQILSATTCQIACEDNHSPEMLTLKATSIESGVITEKAIELEYFY